MPLPIALAPLALGVLRIGGAMALGAALARRRGPERLDILTEDALDRLPEGAQVRVDRDAGRADAEGRWRRTVRLGARGPGLEVEFAGIGRIRARRV